MQFTIYLSYSRRFVSILMLLGCIVLGGGCCLKQSGLVYSRPTIHMSGDGSEAAAGQGKIGKRILRLALEKIIGRRSPQKAAGWKQCCCGHIFNENECKAFKNSYMDLLFYSLDEYMKMLTEEEKEDITRLIVKLPCGSITELTKCGIQPREVLEGLSAELGIDEKKLGG